MHNTHVWGHISDNILDSAACVAAHSVGVAGSDVASCTPLDFQRLFLDRRISNGEKKNQTSPNGYIM